ncbi:helix-turn-helix domain-containing protein [Dickeya fangzhongdai]|uniref:helix-turn-helix domain-containing protein n=1 Tax=Dickeya fangzhongdai TaxID=1778540 RepID=UPI0023E38291|nr:helix-turn-helix transcriptional regulator [Dickeya fangzhongdai]WES88080.1 helix-turn-helix transcriptional regulator [Dickeya fangzhongdai]
MNFDSLCASRLKTERIRLALKQGDAADVCGVSREMWSKYERGIAVPGGDVLAQFALAGANIQYVLTGNSDIPSVEITKDESELIRHYRDAPLAVKAAVLAALTADMSGNHVSQVFHGNVSGQFAGNQIVNNGSISNKKKK